MGSLILDNLGCIYYTCLGCIYGLFKSSLKNGLSHTHAHAHTRTHTLIICVLQEADSIYAGLVDYEWAQYICRYM